jgi:hypothetical protein
MIGNANRNSWYYIRMIGTTHRGIGMQKPFLEYKYQTVGIVKRLSLPLLP